MTVLTIHDVSISDDSCTVEAIVEDAIMLLPGTRYEPAEYGPGLCKATFFITPDTPVFDSEEHFIQYLDEIKPAWYLIPVG